MNFEFLISKEVWGSIALLILGAFIGAIISVWATLRAKKPKLIIGGIGGGGGPQQRRWGIYITNKPSFFGQYLEGETAHDIRAQIQHDENRSQVYGITWGHDSEARVTLEPGDNRRLDLFHWQKGSKGYYIADDNNKAVARFQDRECKFILTLRDRLGRKTEIRFIVEFDDTHLQRDPNLIIKHPVTFRERVYKLKRGWQYLKFAFKRR